MMKLVWLPEKKEEMRNPLIRVLKKYHKVTDSYRLFIFYKTLFTVLHLSIIQFNGSKKKLFQNYHNTYASKN